MVSIMRCELCGKELPLVRAEIEGSTLSVCQQCCRFGKIVGKVSSPSGKSPTLSGMPGKIESRPEPVLSLIPDYGVLIKKKREAMGLTQEEFAKKINEKESLLHKIETNNFEMSIPLAEKLERFLHITLIQQAEDTHESIAPRKREGFTLGDFIKVK
ncbi:TIGR00270 family protein [Candidatus Woesearchaeota archaeon]|nr:TIGR00270 family protein [Candidatus Woesearchaeota archaeon]